MTRHSQSQHRQLCPHLAAAALWTKTGNFNTRRGKARVIYARAHGPAMDDFLAL
jgi:hypothetical protein